jgi:transcription initiation factor IIE alpha subunit
MAGRPEEEDSIDLLRVVANSDDPVVTTQEVAEQVSIGVRRTRDRLYELADEGLLEFKKAGNTPVFWISEMGVERIDSSG